MNVASPTAQMEWSHPTHVPHTAVSSETQQSIDDVLLPRLRGGVEEGKAGLVGAVDERQEGSGIGVGLKAELDFERLQLTEGCKGVQICDGGGDLSVGG